MNKNNKPNNKLHLKITTPLGIFLEKDVDEAIIPGSEGYFGVLYGHTPFLTSIRPGILKIFSQDSEEKYSIHNGFAIVNFDEISILTELIEKPEDIDKTRAESAKERAEKHLKMKKEDTDFRRAEIALRRALARLQVLQK